MMRLSFTASFSFLIHHSYLPFKVMKCPFNPKDMPNFRIPLFMGRTIQKYLVQFQECIFWMSMAESDIHANLREPAMHFLNSL